MKQLTGIALGTFPLANVFGKIKEEEASKILRKFIEYGGEFIHVSLVYNNCEVERFLGRELKKYPRDSYKIMACCGWGYNNGVFRLSGQPKDIEECCNGVLQRLNLDYLDILMSHAPDRETPFEETIDYMNDLRNAGKCRELCVSNVSLEDLKRYNYKGYVDYIQNRFSLLNQSMDSKFFDYCVTNSISITTYQSVERGILTDRIINGIRLDGEDLRTKKPEFKKAVQMVIGEWIQNDLKPIAEKLNVSISTLVLYWTLHNQPIDAVLCGISKEKYFNDYLSLSKLELPISVLTEINNSYSHFENRIRNQFKMSVREFMGIV